MKNVYTLQDVLSKVYKDLDLEDKVCVYEVKRAYNDVMGSLIVKLTEYLKVEGGTLNVKLASAALRQELSMRKTSIVGQINDKLGGKAVVEDINFF